MRYYIIPFILIISLVTGCVSVAGEEHLPSVAETVTYDSPNQFKYIIETSQMPRYKIPLSLQLQKYIWELAGQYDLSYEMILALIKIESDFVVDAISFNNSSFGIMQLNNNTYPWLANELGIEDFEAFNPKQNIKAGVYYLSWLREYWRQYGLSEEDIFGAVLISYHRGIVGSKKYIQEHGFDSRYVQAVLDYKIQLEKGDFNVTNFR